MYVLREHETSRLVVHLGLELVFVLECARTHARGAGANLVDQALKVKLEKHVTECPNCFVVFDTTKKTIKIYKGIEPQVIPEDIHSRLMAALHKKMAAGKCQS